VGNNCWKNTKEIIRCGLQGKKIEVRSQKPGVRSQNEEKNKEWESIGKLYYLVFFFLNSILYTQYSILFLIGKLAN